MLLKQSALLRRVVFDGYDYGLLFTYFTGIAEVLKRFRGRFVGEKEHPLYRAWRLSKEVVHEDVGGLFSALREADSGQTVDVGTLDAFVAALDAARAQADRSLFTAGLRIRLGQLSGAGGVLLHSLPYHPGVVAVARSMRGRWLKPIKSWRLQASIEVVRSNLLAELGLDEDQIELAPGELEIVEDGTAVVRSDRPTISVPAEEMPPSKAAAEEDGDSDVYLATVAPHGRSTLTDAEFEAVSASLKVSLFRTMARVTVPVCLPAVLDISIYLFVNAMTTVSAVIFLYSTDTKLASVSIINMDESGFTAAAAAMAITIVATSAGVKVWVPSSIRAAGPPTNREESAAASRAASARPSAAAARRPRPPIPRHSDARYSPTQATPMMRTMRANSPVIAHHARGPMAIATLVMCMSCQCAAMRRTRSSPVSWSSWYSRYAATSTSTPGRTRVWMTASRNTSIPR